MAEKLKRFIINGHGFDSRAYITPTMSGARYADFMAGRDAGYFRDGFKAYLEGVGFCWRDPNWRADAGRAALSDHLPAGETP